MNSDLAAQRALDRLAKIGFDALSETDQTLAAVWLFDAGVSNNGFARYFASQRGDLAFHAPAALRKIGAKQLAEIAAEANAVFGPGGPPRELKTRRALVRGFAKSLHSTLEALEKRYYASSENIDELLEAFLTREQTGGA